MYLELDHHRVRFETIIKNYYLDLHPYCYLVVLSPIVEMGSPASQPCQNTLKPLKKSQTQLPFYRKFFHSFHHNIGRSL